MAQPAYCKVVRPVAFHHNNMNLSLTASGAGGRVCTSPLDGAGAGAILAALGLTKNATTAPKSVAPTALGGKNQI